MAYFGLIRFELRGLLTPTLMLELSGSPFFIPTVLLVCFIGDGLWLSFHIVRAADCRPYDLFYRVIFEGLNCRGGQRDPA